MKILEKICVYAIYGCIAAVILTLLWVDNGFVFPYVSARLFAFRTIAEIMLVIYAVLWAINDAYRPRINKTALFLLLFIAAAFISSLINQDFYRSFWGNVERGEGLILWLHLAAYLLIAQTVVRQEKIWLALMDIFVGVEVVLGIFALSQTLRPKYITSIPQTRADAFIGNPAFLAALLVFGLFFASYLFYRRKNLAARIYYAVSAVLFLAATVATQTRGAFLGLAVGFVSALLLLGILYGHSRRMRRAAAIVIIAFLILLAGLFSVRNQSWYKNSPYLRSLTAFSLEERTAQTRFASWYAAWRGFLEKPILGGGLESYSKVFDKHFPAIIYEDEGSEVWFDRAHNVVLDRAVTSGLVGLALYLAFLFYPAYRMIKKSRKQPELRIAAVIVSGFSAAFFVQDLFLFESVTAYTSLVFTWSFFGAVLLNDDKEWRLRLPVLGRSVLAVLCAAVFIPVVLAVNVRPAQANRAMAAALKSDPEKEDFFKTVDHYKEALDADTYGTSEYLTKFTEFLDAQLAPVGEVIPEVLPILTYDEDLLAQQIAREPRNVRLQLLAMRHYNNTRNSIAGDQEGRLQKALAFFPAAIKLSPDRPQVWQEDGYSRLYLFIYYKEKGDAAAAEQYARAEEDFKKTLAINPKVAYSHVNLVMLYLNAQQPEKTLAALEQMVSDRSNYNRTDRLSRIMDLAKANKGYEAVIYISDLLLQVIPNDPQTMISKAAAYAYLGNKKQAIAEAEKIRQINASYSDQVDEFIRNINSGFYDKK